jgi:hypothetical protein
MSRPRAKFLNVDLDVFSKASLEPLVRDLGERVVVHYQGREGRRFSAHLSLTVPGSPDRAILKLASLIRKLSSETKRVWSQAETRTFSIGIQAEFLPPVLEFVLSSEAVLAAADLNGRIAITIYASQQEGAIRSRVVKRRPGRRTTA